jgi:hypothetical protein
MEHVRAGSLSPVPLVELVETPTDHHHLFSSPAGLLPFIHNKSVEKNYSHSLVINYEP